MKDTAKVSSVRKIAADMLFALADHEREVGEAAKCLANYIGSMQMLVPKDPIAWATHGRLSMLTRPDTVLTINDDFQPVFKRWR